MSTAATPQRHDAALSRHVTLADRVLVATPLASVYVWLCGVYAVEAWKRATPWLFTDELELTQLSRSIAATGHAARRGEPHSFHSLYTVMTAPVWLIHDVATAYSGIKYLDVFVMASAVFPTYFLARMVVGKGWALFAGAGAAAIPSLAYSSWLVEETLAYPYTALCFFLIAKALVTQRRAWVAGAIVAAAVAPAVRGELFVIPIGFALAAFLFLWSSDWARARRAAWTLGDWLGFVTLAAGAVIVVSGFLSWHSKEWLMVTAYNWTKHRAIIYGDWAAGSLAIGLGVVPLVAGLASAFPVRGETRTRELRAFRAVLVAGVAWFGLYTAMKAGYLSEVFATRVEERNLIYVSPLLFVGTALVLDRRRVNVAALLAATAYGFYLVVGTPFQMNVQLYSDALGLAILQQANRYYEWTPVDAQWLLIAITLGGAALVLALVLVRNRTAGLALAALLAVAILVWNVTGEISAAAGNVSVSRELASTLRHPFSWVDDVANGKPTLYLAQGVGDQNPEWLLEFWNRSIVSVSSLDGTLGGPGPAGSPNITHTGQLYWTLDPAHPGRLYDYAVEDWPCIDFAGSTVATHLYRGGAAQLRQWRLVQLTKPNRLRAECTGIYPDGWTGANDTSYFRFGGGAGWLRIELTRQNWPSTPVRVETGPIGERLREPAIVQTRTALAFTLRTRAQKVVWVRVPRGGLGVRVVIEKKFSPHAIDPRIGDPRTLGAQVNYRFYTRRPAS